MSALAVLANDNHEELSAVIYRARAELDAAVSSAKILETRVTADVVYDTSKRMARAARAQGAHADVVAKAHRLQADALELKSLADIRLADEYDAAQARGEVAGPNDGSAGRFNQERPATVADIGLTRKIIHDARQTRNLEAENPGIIRQSLDALIAANEEPSKASLAREATRLSSFSGDNEWYTPAKYIEMAREVMGSIDVDPASNATAQAVVRAGTHYTAETDGLDKDWLGTVWMNPPYSNPEIQNFVEHLLVQIGKGNVTEAIVLTNNSGDTAWHHDLAEASSAMCITRGRIRFESPTRESNSPAMGQSFFYFGPNRSGFAKLFETVGRITTNYDWRADEVLT